MDRSEYQSSENATCDPGVISFRACGKSSLAGEASILQLFKFNLLLSKFEFEVN